MTKEEIKDLYSNSNTSHVTINLVPVPRRRLVWHSNTSHVLIYPLL